VLEYCLSLQVVRDREFRLMRDEQVEVNELDIIKGYK
jgi:hypothetical protein